VLQLALQGVAPGAPCTVYLLQIAWAGLTARLRGLLEDAGVAKAGCNASGDAQKLFRDFGVVSAGVVDLDHLAQTRLEAGSRWSLAALCARVLSRTLPKPPALRLSAWDARRLSPQQEAYAALDAFASLALFHRLSALPLLPPLPPPPPLPPGSLAAGARAALSVSALPRPAALSAAKASVLALHAAGLGVAAIAEARVIKPVTVTNYLAEAIDGGHAYRWDLLDVPPAFEPLIEAAIEAEEAAAAAAEAEVEAGAAAEEPPAADADAVLRGRMKALKVRLPEEVSFGHLRLVLAHRARMAQQAALGAAPPPVPPAQPPAAAGGEAAAAPASSAPAGAPAPSGTLRHFTASDGAVLAYAEHVGGCAAAPPLLLVHGWSGSRRYWDAALPHLLPLCSAAFALELRWHGDSAAAGGGAPRTVPRLGEDLQCFLEARCAGTRPVLLGSSLGAAVGWSYLARLGARHGLAALVAIDQAPLQNRAEDWALGSRGCFDGPSLAALQAALRADMGAFADANAACCLSLPIPAATAALLKAETLRCNAQALGELMADHTARDWRALLRSLSLPLLAVAGERSGCFPVEGSLWAARNTGRGTAVVMLACNHWLYIEQPERFAAIVADFLATLGGVVG